MATGALAYAPMPPVRPDLASLHPRLSAPPQPDRRVAEAAAGIPHPLPPARPPQPIQVASIGPVSIPPAPQPQAAPRVSAEQRDQLRALFAKSQMGTVAAAPAPRRDVAPVRLEPKLPAGALASGPGLALRFTTERPGLSSDRFSGRAVEPLPVSR
jgi:hypothetical protein